MDDLKIALFKKSSIISASLVCLFLLTSCSGGETGDDSGDDNENIIEEIVIEILGPEIEVNEGTEFELTISDSSNLTLENISWEQISGPEARIAQISDSAVEIEAPQVPIGQTLPVEFSLSVVVDNNGQSVERSVSITINIKSNDYIHFIVDSDDSGGEARLYGYDPEIEQLLALSPDEENVHVRNALITPDRRKVLYFLDGIEETEIGMYDRASDESITLTKVVDEGETIEQEYLVSSDSQYLLYFTDFEGQDSEGNDIYYEGAYVSDTNGVNDPLFLGQFDDIYTSGSSGPSVYDNYFYFEGTLEEDSTERDQLFGFNTDTLELHEISHQTHINGSRILYYFVVGDRLFFTTEDAADIERWYFSEKDGSNVQQLGDDNFQINFFSISEENSQSFLYVGYELDTEKKELVRVDFDDASETVLISADYQVHSLDFRMAWIGYQENKALILSDIENDDQLKFYTVDILTGEIASLSEEISLADNFYSWRFAGTNESQIVFLADRDNSGTFHLYSFSDNNPIPIQLTSFLPADESVVRKTVGYFINISPDKEWINFETETDDLELAGIYNVSVDGNLFTADLRTEDQTELEDDGYYYWSLDGSSLAFTERPEDSTNVYSMNPDATGVVLRSDIVNFEDAFMEDDPDWSPDSSALLFYIESEESSREGLFLSLNGEPTPIEITQGLENTNLIHWEWAQ